MSGVAPYRDGLGCTEPSERIAGPGHLYIGNLPRGRVVECGGRRMKIISQSEGSTTVRVSKPGKVFARSDGSVGRIDSSSDEIPIARGTIVRVPR